MKRFVPNLSTSFLRHAPYDWQCAAGVLLHWWYASLGRSSGSPSLPPQAARDLLAVQGFSLSDLLFGLTGVPGAN